MPVRDVLRRLIDLILYSNLWIAMAALSLHVQVRWLLLGQIAFGPLDGFVFFATVFLYAVHRLIALHRLTGFTLSDRFQKISRRRRDILVYAILAGLATLFFFGRLERSTQFLSLAPALLSLLYVLPIFSGGRRLRDFHFLKIFLIALVWTWVTVVLPAFQVHLLGQIPVWLLILERFFFVFAITVPFDVRDLHLDRQTQVATLPARLGISRALWVALSSLLLAALTAFWLYRMDVYSTPAWIGWLATTALTAGLIVGSRPDRHDYYFTGWLDGTMILLATLVITLDQWFY